MRRLNRRFKLWIMAAGGAAAVGLGALAGGCTTEGYVDGEFVCEDPTVPGATDPDGPCHDAGPDAAACGDAGPDAGEDCADAGAGIDTAMAPGFEPTLPQACPGQCVPRAPLGWSEPALLWIGPPDQAPDCPASAPSVGYEGHADFTAAPHACPACLCDPPDASCELPAAWSAHASFPCDVPGAAETSFAAPDGWDGACASTNAVAAGQPCDGALCAQSLEIPAPRVLPGTCAPRVVEAPEGAEEPGISGGFAILARACTGTVVASCGDPGTTCIPAPPAGDGAPPEGFLTCIHHEGEQDCPETYPDRHVFYAGADDTRSCAPCGCAEPSGASCSILASAFSDGACSQFVVGVVVSSAAPFCGAISPGTALGSKSASTVSLDPGTCAPTGGEPTGGVALRGAATFCCRPEAVPEQAPT
ncbi:hypothetical protein [Sorangium sp. So ce1182]|uniref:hypothetical protein n=1 Tax=Sorangium sp. So ce1182 TaxID=3133334 RepID=UPI003F6088B1